MSLAPAERRALDKIEDGLRRSDRRLTRMLTRFRVPLSRGGLMILVRNFRWRSRPVGWAVAVTVATLVVVAILNGPATPLTCSTPRGTGSVAALQASNCQRALQRGHEAATVENGGTPP